jgi:hypothetical protein
VTEPIVTPAPPPREPTKTLLTQIPVPILESGSPEIHILVFPFGGNKLLIEEQSVHDTGIQYINVIQLQFLVELVTLDHPVAHLIRRIIRNDRHTIPTELAFALCERDEAHLTMLGPLAYQRETRWNLGIRVAVDDDGR